MTRIYLTAGLLAFLTYPVVAQTLPTPKAPKADTLTVTGQDGSTVSLKQFYQSYQNSSSASGALVLNVADGLSAAGTTISDATILAASTNAVTTVASGSGVRLPNVATGTVITVMNSGANNLNIYPDGTSSQIESLGNGNAQYLIPGGKMALIKMTSTQWRIQN